MMADEKVQHMLPPNLVPDFLKSLDGWVVWRYEKGEGPKPRKIPYYADGSRRRGTQGSPEDRQRLASFEDAFAQYRTNQWSGIGFAMLPDWNLVGVDFDNCIHGGVIDADILSLVGTTYAEVSPSGNGIRAFFKGQIDDRKDHAADFKTGMEIFCRKGFLTITGNHLGHISLVGDDAAQLTPELTREYARRFPTRDAAPTPSPIADGSLHEARQLLHRVSPDCSYSDWLSIGMALHHQSSGSVAGLALWNDWSVPSAKYPTDGFPILQNKWESFGKNSDKPVTLNTLRKLANVATSDDFAPCDPTRFAVRKYSDFSDRPPLRWFIKQVLPVAGLGVVFGESGSGKTFFVTDLALAIAQGQQWREHRTRKAKVVYICAEGFNGFLNRLKAHEIATGANISEIDFGIIADVPNLLKLDHLQVAEQIAASGGADVIIIDTFAQVTPGANENGAEDMGKALAHCRELHEKSGAMVLLVHHAGKDTSKGARGWSGIKAAADVEIEISRQDDIRCARVTKLKDSEDGGEYFFVLKTVPLGVDEDGDVVTSCVLESIDKPVLESTTVGVGTESGVGARGGAYKPRGAWESLVYRLVSQLGGSAGLATPCAEVTAEAIKQTPVPEGDDRRKERVLRAMMNMQDKGCLLIKDDMVWLNLQDLA